MGSLHEVCTNKLLYIYKLLSLYSSLDLHYNLHLVLHADNKQTPIAVWKRLFLMRVTILPQLAVSYYGFMRKEPIIVQYEMYATCISYALLDVPCLIFSLSYSRYS